MQQSVKTKREDTTVAKNKNDKQNTKAVNETAAVTENETEKPIAAPVFSEPEPVKDTEGNIVPHVFTVGVRAELQERKGRSKDKGGRKVADFATFQIDHPEATMIALRGMLKSDKAIVLAVNKLLLRKATERARIKAFSVTKNIQKLIDMLVAGGATQDEAEKRALAAFAGQQ
jgi:hypothetical protein